MTKLVADFKYGTLSAGIGSTDTTITSAEFADLPVVSSPDTMDLVLNPGEVGGDAEIVTVTAHTSASTSVTVAARTGSAHGSGTQWVHAVTAADFNRMGFDGTLEGNADTATALETARTIGGVSFDGTANINLPGVNTAGNQDTSGNAATATALETARTIGGVSFDGTANINLPGVNTAGNQHTSGNAATASLAADSSLLGGLGLSAGNSAPSGSQVIKSHTNGYTYLGWINTTSGATTSTISRIYASNDAFVRYVTPATFRSQVTDPYYLLNTSDTLSGNLTVTGNVTAQGNMYIGKNGGGDSYLYFYDDNSNAWREIYWDDSENRFRSSHNIKFNGYVHAGTEMYVGDNGGSDSWIHFYDDNSNTWRTFGWDDSANRYTFEGNIQINGTVLSDPGSANNLRVTTAHGYLDLGPQNSTYCHIYTDRAQFYTNKGFNSVPFIYWRNNSGVGGPLTDTSTGTGYRYVFQNQTYGTFFDYSSIRARKEQIVNVTEADAGRWIDALQPVTFIERWMGEGEEPEDNKAFREADMQVGFIADDILDNPDTTHFSQVLDNGEGGFDPAGWKWECVIATCVAEIKALRARVATLEAG